jgi:arabinose-5-phosphate isomerase
LAKNTAQAINQNRDRDLEAARAVLASESSALNILGESLGDSFVAALDMLFELKGRVVVSGMGKAGHVGRKIAATLASTGTPALFIHPGEASHGDLGMITRGEDALLILSNSGETTELSDLVAYSRRFEVPLIAISGKGGSTLAEAADVALVLPDVEEACPMGLAPTTSTTMMVALGDALAVALLERRGFGANEFHELHPGGTLGHGLIKVSDIMHSDDDVPLITADRPMSEALLEMTSKSFGCVGVIDAQKNLLGIVTDGDLRRHMDDDLIQKSVNDIMTANPKWIRPGALAAEALAAMTGASRGDSPGITSLFVVDDDKVVGILHIHDCLRHRVA